MPNLRFTLWLALGAILYYNYLAWQQDYRPPPALNSAVTGSASAPNSLDNALPTPAIPASGAGLPAAAASSQGATGAPGTPGAAPAESAEAAPAGTVHVVTDVLDLNISLRGGEIDRADLTQYPLHKDTPNVPVRLENSDPATLYLLQTGLIGKPDEPAPSHMATLSAAQEHLHAGSRCTGAARSTDLERRPRLDRDQDLRLHPRLVPHRSRL